MKIDLINGRRTNEIFATARYTHEILKRIKDIQPAAIEYPKISNNEFIDGGMKRFVYPWIVKSRIHSQSIKHITHQDLSFLLTIMDLHPTIITCHDLIPISYYHIESFYWKQNLKGLKLSDCIITVSEFSKNEIIRLAQVPNDRVRIIPNGVDRSIYYPKPDRSILDKYSIKPTDPVLLFVGSEEPRKNISLLIRTLGILKRRLPNIKLIKVGGSQMGGDRSSLNKIIQKLKLETNVIFTGSVCEKDLSAFYNAADVFIFPSFYEGFGLPPLEAMACGCPVIISDRTSLPEVVSNAGLYINPDNEEDLAEKILYILNNPEVKNEMISRGLDRARVFSWEDSAKKMLDIYHEFEYFA